MVIWRIRATEAVNDPRSPRDTLYWSAEIGWTWKAYADVFTTAEKIETDLPPHGVWEVGEI